jgi:hypothetical protein
MTEGGNMSGPEPTIIAPLSQYSTAFEAFWRLYPRKIAKQDAFVAWRKALKTTPSGEIFQGLERQLARLQAVKEAKGESFVPHPATWINGHRWHDEVEPTPEQKAAASDLTQFIVSRVQAYRRLVAADPSKAERYFAQQPPVVRDAIERAH